MIKAVSSHKTVYLMGHSMVSVLSAFALVNFFHLFFRKRVEQSAALQLGNTLKLLVGSFM